MASTKYSDIVVEIVGKIGVIKFNRPESLNSFGGNLQADTIDALRELNEHPDTVLTVLTGEGRFFSSGADVRDMGSMKTDYASIAAHKVAVSAGLTSAVEIVRSVIEHKKVFVLALNGPAVGGGAAWFTGTADIVFATPKTYLQVPFSSLGLVPEYGSAHIFSQSIGIHRANDFFIFGRKVTAPELESWGLVNRIFPEENFQKDVLAFLQEQLRINDGKSMVEAKRLQNEPLRAGRLLALAQGRDALAEAFVEGRPAQRFMEKKEELEAKSKKRGAKL